MAFSFGGGLFYFCSSQFSSRGKYPDRVPVIVERAPKSTAPLIDKVSGLSFSCFLPIVLARVVVVDGTMGFFGIVCSPPMFPFAEKVSGAF